MAAPRAVQRQNRTDPVVILLWVLFVLLAIGTVATALWAFAGVPMDTLLRPWMLSRAIGIVAYLLLWASVVVGLVQSMWLLKGITRPVANVDVHEFISQAAIYTSLFHALILVFDHPEYALSLPEVLIPFVAQRQSVLTGIGIVALYLSVIASVTTYMRGKMNPKLWRVVHLSSLVGFLMALAHGVAMGSDSQFALTWLMYIATGASTLVLVVMRIMRRPAAGPAASLPSERISPRGIGHRARRQ